MKIAVMQILFKNITQVFVLKSGLTAVLLSRNRIEKIKSTPHKCKQRAYEGYIELPINLNEKGWWTLSLNFNI